MNGSKTNKFVSQWLSKLKREPPKRKAAVLAISSLAMILAVSCLCVVAEGRDAGDVQVRPPIGEPQPPAHSFEPCDTNITPWEKVNGVQPPSPSAAGYSRLFPQ